MCLTIFIRGRPCRYNLWKHSWRYTASAGVRLPSPYLWGAGDPPRPPVQSQLPVLLSAPPVPLHHCHDSSQFCHQTTNREWGNSWGVMHNSTVFKIFFNKIVNELRMFCRKYAKCKMLTVTIIKKHHLTYAQDNFVWRFCNSNNSHIHVRRFVTILCNLRILKTYFEIKQVQVLSKHLRI